MDLFSRVGWTGSEDSSKSRPRICRACTDFKTWVQQKKGNAFSPRDENVKDSSSPDHLRSKECPLDKDNLGNFTWSFLHTMAAYYPDEPSSQQQKEMSVFMKLFSKYYPCDNCAKDFRKEIIECPPDTVSRSSFSLWLCKMHNIVNTKLGKAEFDCSVVDQRWRDGWSSGICDE